MGNPISNQLTPGDQNQDENDVPAQPLPNTQQLPGQEVNANWSSVAWARLYTPLSNWTFFRNPRPDEYGKLITLPGYRWNDWATVQFMNVQLGMRIGTTAWRIVHKIAHSSTSEAWIIKKDDEPELKVLKSFNRLRSSGHLKQVADDEGSSTIQKVETPLFY